MKKIKIVWFIAALFLISPSDISAQVRVNLNINLQPQWGPDDYDYVEYYFMPEFGIYYYAPKAQFIYRHGNTWVYASRLPYQYRNVNLYSTYKVVINEPRPYLRNNYYVSHYKGYRGYHSKQGTIRDSKNPKYRSENNHQSNEQNRMGNKPSKRDVQSQSGERSKNERHVTVKKNGKDNNSRGNKDSKNSKNNHR